MLAAVLPCRADDDNYCDAPGEAPDVIVGDIGAFEFPPDIVGWGTIGGISAYSVGATACNIGTCWARWNGGSNTHPVMAVNAFELKNGRFLQIGQQWVKHTFAADYADFCGTCCVNPQSFDAMGVSCSDLYLAAQNGGQRRMGLKSAINPHTGFYVYNPASYNQAGNEIYKRLQIHNLDLDPELNHCARFFIEVQYIVPDDAFYGTGDNNASYRQAVVSVTDAGGYELAFAGETIIGQPGIMAWRAADPSVTIMEARYPDDGKLLIGTKVTFLGSGLWRYEYAIQNLNSQKAPVAMSIQVPSGTQVTNLTYHDVDYHSGDPQNNTPWTKSFASSTITWKSSSLVLEGEIQNALRWGTLYNFGFDATAPPGTRTMKLGFKEQSTQPFQDSVTIPAIAPSVCDGDGICDPGETCATCAADCSHQGGGSGCCGNGTCQAGESPTTCFADCGPIATTETVCSDGIDADRDGLTDCFDPDCRTDPACGAFDYDADGYTAACDCSEANASSWGTPGEVKNLRLANDLARGAVLSWAAPKSPGTSVLLEYEALRATDATGFASAACVSSQDPTALSAEDAGLPAAGAGFYYLVRAKNTCPAVGPLGWSSSGTPQTAPACP